LKAAMVIIDMQKYFYRMDKQLFDIKIIPNLVDILEYIRKKDIDVIHVKTEYKEDKSNWPEAYKNESDIWCMENTDDSEIIDQLRPINGETVIIKKRFTAFYDTNLQSELLNKRIDTLLICGYSADVCVRFSTMDAYNIGFKLYWLKDCMDSAFEEFGKSLYYIKQLTKLIDLDNHEFKEVFK
jgi:nicotinamidase-related amidase